MLKDDRSAMTLNKLTTLVRAIFQDDLKPYHSLSSQMTLNYRH